MNIGILGGGLAGLSLAYYLIDKGCKVQIFDSQHPLSATRLSAGMLTPITGMNCSINWNFETFYPSALALYTSLDAKQTHPIIRRNRYKRFFRTEKERLAFSKRYPTHPIYRQWSIMSILPNNTDDGFHNPLGGFSANNVHSIDVQTVHAILRKKITAHHPFEMGTYSIETIIASENNVRYRGHTFDAFVCCDGFNATRNHWFNWIPFQLLRSDTLTFYSESLDASSIYNRGKWVLPLDKQRFKYGSTHFRVKHLSHSLEKAGYDELSRTLNESLNVPFQEEVYQSAYKMTVPDKRPVIGQHPTSHRLYIANGFGSKGVLSIPFCTRTLALHITEGTPIPSELDIKRWIS